MACALFAPSPARAASLSGPVTGWGTGVPSYVSMYEYVPDELAASPPIVVAAHFCNGSASALFGYTGMPPLVAAADTYGFILIFPQTTNANSSSRNCWDVGSQASLTRDGGGDTHAIVQMVEHEIATRNADPERVYVMGISSGAMLVQALLAVYPDVFKAGSEFSGVPAGCWASGYSASSNWSEPCAQGMVTKTPEEWGALVQAMNPGYSGYRPRIQLWHGTADTTIDYANQTEAIDEWTNLLGLDTAPSSTEMPSGYEVAKWRNSCGYTVLEAYTQNGGGHTTPVDASSIVRFFGLDETGPDPQIAACGPSGNGGSGGGAGGAGSGGNAGESGNGGAGVGGSRGGAAGSGASGGAGVSGGGGTPVSGAGGSSGSMSDNSGRGGMNTSGTAGTPGSGGLLAAGGTGGSNAVRGGTGGSASGTAGGGTAAAGGGSLADEQDAVGCGCELGAGRDSRGARGGLTLAALALVLACRSRKGMLSRPPT